MDKDKALVLLEHKLNEALVCTQADRNTIFQLVNIIADDKDRQGRTEDN